MQNLKMKMLEWKIHSKKQEFKRLLEETEDIVSSSSAKAKFITSWSTGKDSTAMMHIVNRLLPKNPIVIQFDDCDWPEKKEYFKKICDMLNIYPHIVEPDFSVWEEAVKSGIGVSNLCAQSHDLTRYGFIKPLELKRKELNCDGVYLGLRISEGRARKLNLATRGHTYQLKDGSWRCNPLWRWSAKDVFAYLASKDIPINPCYLKNMFIEPEDIRLSWALPTEKGLSKTDMSHIRYYYPEHYRKLISIGVAEVA